MEAHYWLLLGMSFCLGRPPCSACTSLVVVPRTCQAHVRSLEKDLSAVVVDVPSAESWCVSEVPQPVSVRH